MVRSVTLFNKTRRLRIYETDLLTMSTLTKVGADVAGAALLKADSDTTDAEQFEFVGVVYEHPTFDEVPEGKVIPCFKSIGLEDQEGLTQVKVYLRKREVH